MSSTQSKVATYSECAVVQSGKGQDYAINGIGWDEETGEEYEWNVLADGHGTDHFIDKVRKTNFGPFMAKSNPIADIIEYFASFNGTYRKQYHDNAIGVWTKYNCRSSSGCTIIIAKIYKNRIEGAVIGDSRCAVYIDGEQVFISTPHNINNPAEELRLFSSGSTLTTKDYERDPVPQIIGSNKLQPVRGGYAIFPDGTRLAVTQALGHDCSTGFAPQLFSVGYSPGQRVRYVAGSDGFWDMHLSLEDIEPSSSEADVFRREFYAEALVDARKDREDILNMTAPELAQKAVSRWSQEWNYHWKSSKKLEVNKCSFPETDYDDVCVYVWDNGMPTLAKKKSDEKIFEHAEYVAGLLNGSIEPPATTDQ